MKPQPPVTRTVRGPDDPDVGVRVHNDGEPTGRPCVPWPHHTVRCSLTAQEGTEGAWRWHRAGLSSSAFEPRLRRRREPRQHDEQTRPVARDHLHLRRGRSARGCVMSGRLGGAPVNQVTVVGQRTRAAGCVSRDDERDRPVDALPVQVVPDQARRSRRWRCHDDDPAPSGASCTIARERPVVGLLGAVVRDRRPTRLSTSEHREPRRRRSRTRPVRSTCRRTQPVDDRRRCRSADGEEHRRDQRLDPPVREVGAEPGGPAARAPA